MGYFSKRTPILRLNSGNVVGARWVFWPVFVWRVVVPQPRPRRLNLFQKGVLGLARAGVADTETIADRLLLAPDLVSRVLTELEGMNLIDLERAPTRRGVAELEDIERETPVEMSVGHVFTDPRTGKLWPRFLTGDLPLAEIEFSDDGWPIMISGTHGNPWKDRGFCLLLNEAAALVVRPSPRDVLRAVGRHRRRIARDNVDDGRELPEVDRVSFVTEHPQPYLVALRVRRHPSGDWQVDDPFGHGESIDLRSSLEDQLDRVRGLRDWVAPLVGGEQGTNTIHQLHAKAAWDVEERLTLEIKRYPGLHTNLIAMQRALLEASVDGAPADKRDDVLLKAQRAAERVMNILMQSYRDSEPPIHEALAESDRDYNQNLLDEIAAGLGFRRPLPESLTAIRRGKVQWAEQRGGGTLRPLLVLALLYTDNDEHHPLRRAAARGSNLLIHRLDDLARARDRAAHDGATSWSRDVARHVETVFITVEALLLAPL